MVDFLLIYFGIGIPLIAIGIYNYAQAWRTTIRYAVFEYRINWVFSLILWPLALDVILIHSGMPERYWRENPERAKGKLDLDGQIKH